MRWGWSLLRCAGLVAALPCYAQGDNVAARAERGDPSAVFQLATMYDLGERGPQDPTLAFEWYRRAAQAGLPEAEFNVAVMYDSGRGATQDQAQAAAWYGRAAVRGNHRAQYNLALLYDAGAGVPHNAQLAAFWLRQAAPAIPAAEQRIITLQADKGTATISAAILSAPERSVEAGTAPVEFVWTATAQPEPVRYMIEVQALGRIASSEAYSEYTDGSAALAPLRRKPGEYAWRVFTVARVAAHYAVSDWKHFRVLPQSAASAQRAE